MNLESYLDYIAAFNAQDWKRLTGQYYAPDVEIVFPIVTLSGRDEALAWFVAAHEALFETIVPQRIAIDGHTITVDLTVHFVALGPTDYLPIPERGEAGDAVTVPMRAHYTVDEDDQIVALTVEFTSPPQQTQITP
ncbi:hypothetical protein Lesp02_32310 [Lentzea sp. NBRC 105346]|uniref:nuclear transport factor 2 family protein n=1 Tax=Lentzea sp. NBRC 105346 TaxID=3032205 RepID=UPI0024A34053|nr:nuclear transport factor 2 family protein [Lentzea sp. NBRC 105346]GLZ31042.1 hypothetical protein Lesp02_32310 [Lentzea sp. NBRC 105346]